MAARLRLLLVENHNIVRQGFRRLIEERGIEVVGEAADGLEAVQLAKELQPDIVVMDIGLPSLSGIEATRRIVKAVPNTKVIMLTIQDYEQFVFSSLDAGARGYLAKGVPLEELETAIDAVRRGDIYLSSNFPAKVLEKYQRSLKQGKRPDRLSRLTNREREILTLIAEGMTSKEIAGKLFISEKTAENHRANIMAKLDIHDTAGLVRYAVKLGLVE